VGGWQRVRYIYSWSTGVCGPAVRCRRRWKYAWADGSELLAGCGCSTSQDKLLDILDETEDKLLWRTQLDNVMEKV
jgi:hypothetical protein